MPTLRELEAEFLQLGVVSGVTGDLATFKRRGDQMEGADGIIFLCPLCFSLNAGSVGTHRVICWFEGRVPDSVSPKPGRWTPMGSGLDDLTFVSGPTIKAVSVRLSDDSCRWHGHVRNGSAE